MENAALPLRLGVQQRVLPAYRAPFFDLLAGQCAGGLSVLAGQPMRNEAMGLAGELHLAKQTVARNGYLGSGALLLVWQRGLLAWLARWQPDVLIADTNPRNLSTQAAIAWMHARRRPVIGWGLGVPAAGGVQKRLRKAWLGGFDALIAYSSAGKAQYVAAGFPAERIYLAPNAVAPRPSQPPPSLNVPDATSPARVLFVGRLQARKRIDSLLRACASLPPALQPQVQIVGDGPARAELETLARQVYPQTTFRGDLRGSDLAAQFAAADLFVLPGTGGLAVQQAMAYGLPVIVAEADGTQSNLVRPDNGWLLPPNDDAALQAALQAALADRVRLRRMGQASYRIVDEEVNLEAMVQAFVTAIAALHNRSAQGRAD